MPEWEPICQKLAAKWETKSGPEVCLEALNRYMMFSDKFADIGSCDEPGVDTVGELGKDGGDEDICELAQKSLGVWQNLLL